MVLKVRRQKFKMFLNRVGLVGHLRTVRKIKNFQSSYPLLKFKKCLMCVKTKSTK
jgi:hypothetical protein